MANSSASQQNDNPSLDNILTALQHGVQAINNLAQALASIVVPST